MTRRRGAVRTSPAIKRPAPRGPAALARGDRAAGSPRPGRATAARTEARRRRGAAVVAAIALILAGVGLLAFRGGTPPGGAVTSPAAFSLLRLNGTGWVRLASYRGKPVVVNFFASWCTQCQAELPGFVREADALRGKVVFIGVDSLETGDKNFLPDRFGLAGSFAALASDVGQDGNDLHAALGGGDTMPLTAFYSASGRLLDVERGALVPVSVLQTKIAQLDGIR